MNPQFETEADIEREYARLIDREADPLKRSELEVEAAKLKIQLAQQAQKRELVGNWKELALYKFPLARQLHELVTGNSQAEIEASAEAAHKRVDDMLKTAQGPDDQFDRVRQQAQDYYGRAPVGGGGTSNVATSSVDAQKRRAEAAFVDKFNNAPRDAFGQRMGISPQEINTYTSTRFVDHVKDRLNFWAMMTRSDAGRRRV